MRFCCLALVACLTFASGLAVATDFSTVQDGMSAQEFKQAGLDTLTPEQLTALNAWIAKKLGVELNKQEQILMSQKTTGAAGVFDNPALMGFRGFRGERVAVESRLTGDFDGWRGKSHFELENGQIWEQDQPGALDAHRLTKPVAKIKPAFGSSWLLSIDGCGCWLRVVRVK